MDAEAEALTLDVLAESVNLGLGQVIEELSEISGSQIELSVPAANVLPGQQIVESADWLGQQENSLVVQQCFHGGISGQALLVFGEGEGLNLLNSMVAGDGHALVEFAEAEEEMLLDLTNVAVTGVICALASMMGTRISVELPRCSSVQNVDLQKQLEALEGSSDMVLFLSIGITVVKSKARASLLFFQPRSSLEIVYQAVCNRMGLNL